jgi:hypothetical protein
MIKIETKSQLLAAIGWISVFVEGWLIVLRLIPADFLTWMFFVIFFIVAVFASAVAGGKRKA